MVKTKWMALLFISAIGTAPVLAQGGGFEALPSGEKSAAGLLNEHNLTATGKTVPHPGVPQDSGMTELDRQIQKKDGLLERSICANC
ncbi:hypothetical protein [Methylocapsa aurea]|uniref:hypothetical protein n=1 Tax=Methylocapsa aurea TaxID=663610 RepID=UPI00055C7109|nr:hypothetical protein [Methylocapsa aurea]